MKTFNNIFIILFLFTFSIGANAQSHEVPTGPFLDSTNYVPPPPLNKINDKIHKHVSNNENKKVAKKTCTKKSTKKKTLKAEKLLKENEQKITNHKKVE